MTTEDDLRRCGQAAAALVGVAGARVRQAIDEWMGREKAPDDANYKPKSKPETIVEEGRRTAAEAVDAFRRGATAVLGDLERLEHDWLSAKRAPEAPPAPDDAPPAWPPAGRAAPGAAASEPASVPSEPEARAAR